VAWEGVYHPRLPRVYESAQAYLADYAQLLGFTPSATVGLLLSRTNWVNGNLEVERSLIAALEARRVGVIPAFYYSVQDATLGNLSGAQVIERFFVEGGAPRVQAVVKLNAFFLAGGPGEGAGRRPCPGWKCSGGSACRSSVRSSPTPGIGSSGWPTRRGSAPRWGGASPCRSSRGDRALILAPRAARTARRRRGPNRSPTGSRTSPTGGRLGRAGPDAQRREAGGFHPA